MLPTFTVWGFSGAVFPFLIFFAFISCAAVYMFSPIYKKFYRVTVFKICLPVLVSSACGARICSAITLCSSSDAAFWYNLLYGGSVFYGGVIGGMAGLCLVCAYRNYEFFIFSDLFATLLPLGQAIGRLGCYLNGCCYGRQYHGLFAVLYPVEGMWTKVFPTWFVEAGACGALFMYFQVIHKNNTTGSRTAVYLLFYSVFRFFIEFMRGDEIRGAVGPLSSSQIISVFMLMYGLVVLNICFRDKCENYLFVKERTSDAD